MKAEEAAPPAADNQIVYKLFFSSKLLQSHPEC